MTFSPERNFFVEIVIEDPVRERFAKKVPFRGEYFDDDEMATEALKMFIRCRQKSVFDSRKRRIRSEKRLAELI
jgi:hypothetical protein